MERAGGRGLPCCFCCVRCVSCASYWLCVGFSWPGRKGSPSALGLWMADRRVALPLRTKVRSSSPLPSPFLASLTSSSDSSSLATKTRQKEQERGRRGQEEGRGRQERKEREYRCIQQAAPPEHILAAQALSVHSKWLATREIHAIASTEWMKADVHMKVVARWPQLSVFKGRRAG
eukprot:470400-Rhodomonas_salina.2